MSQEKKDRLLMRLYTFIMAVKSYQMRFVKQALRALVAS